LAEPGIKKLKVDDIIQFERFGFCRLDLIEKGTYKFWFAHK
jgi:glutamyl-tRNA synthetase